MFWCYIDKQRYSFTFPDLKTGTIGDHDRLVMPHVDTDNQHISSYQYHWYTNFSPRIVLNWLTDLHQHTIHNHLSQFYHLLANFSSAVYHWFSNFISHSFTTGSPTSALKVLHSLTNFYILTYALNQHFTNFNYTISVLS